MGTANVEIRISNSNANMGDESLCVVSGSARIDGLANEESSGAVGHAGQL